jgi:hypothetical protein
MNIFSFSVGLIALTLSPFLIMATSLNREPASLNYRHLVTEITIHAPASEVWSILLDLDHYAEWNPLIISSKGKAEVGQHLVNVMQPEGQKPTTFKPKVLIADTDKHFAWKGKVAFGGLFDGEHHFELISISTTETKVIQHEYFSGILVPFFKTMLKVNTRHSFEALNQALKKRAEANYQKVLAATR